MIPENQIEASDNQFAHSGKSKDSRIGGLARHSGSSLPSPEHNPQTSPDHRLGCLRLDTRCPAADSQIAASEKNADDSRFRIALDRHY